jgi:hypothetical protein
VRILILYTTLFVIAQIAYGQHLRCDTSGTIINRGTIRFVSDTGKFANRQRDIQKIQNTGVFEMQGRRNSFTDVNEQDGLLGDINSTALGSRPDFRIPGLVRFRKSADSQIVLSRYYTHLEMDEQARKYIVNDVYVAGRYNVTSTSGNRSYNGYFHYDGADSQYIYPESGQNLLLNRYYNVELLVSLPVPGTSGAKILDSGRTAILDGIVKSTSAAPLYLRGNMLLGNLGADSSETRAEVYIRNQGALEVQNRPARFYSNVWVQNGELRLADSSGTATVSSNATITLETSQARIRAARNSSLIITGDYINNGNGTNLFFDPSSTLTYNGSVNQQMERSLQTFPYGNIHTIRAKQARGDINMAGNLRVAEGNIQMGNAVLTMLDGAKQASYIQGNEEVVGSMRRLTLANSPAAITFNNAQTTVEFTTAKSTVPSEMLFYVQPSASVQSISPFQYNALTDADRKITVTYSGASSQPWEARIRAGYQQNEIPNGIDYQTLEFFETAIDTAKNIRTESANPLNIYKRGAASSSTLGYVELSGIRSDLDITSPGSMIFASGKDLLLRPGINPPLRILARALLEGAYRGDSLMGTELRSANLIELTAPDMYPYSLNPNRASETVASIPDSVVDWVSVEIRSQMAGGDKFFRNCFLRSNGTLVDLDGISPVILPLAKQGEYYVVFRHRNHLAVMTANPVTITSRTGNTIDFSQAQNVLGGFAALKALSRLGANDYLYGIPAGDYDTNGLINPNDHSGIWSQRDYEGYLNADTDMNGIVTSRDFNVSWNNRNRITNVP